MTRAENPSSKLTDHDVELVRELLRVRDEARRTARGLTLDCIARKFGVCRNTIWRIAHEDGRE